MTHLTPLLPRLHKRPHEPLDLVVNLALDLGHFLSRPRERGTRARRRARDDGDVRVKHI